MDQLKTQLAAVKQHSFWVMCIGILGVTLGSWWYSTGTLQSQQISQKGAIEKGFSEMTQVTGVQDHPNESTNKGMDELNRRYALEVNKGWQLQYDQQADVLQWPESFEQSGFRAFVDKLRPIEAIAVTDGKVSVRDDLPRDYKEEYRNFIEDELPKFAKTISARWVVSTQGDPSAAGAPPSLAGGFGGAAGLGGGGPGGFAGPGGVDANGQPIVDDAVVLWDPQNQQEILMTHFGFTTRQNLPSTLEVLYAQEDYWILDNIMQIIRATNQVEDTKG